jgi:hypothetical protein
VLYSFGREDALDQAAIKRQVASLSKLLDRMKRGELRGKISARPGLNRYLRVTPGGLLRVDKARARLTPQTISRPLETRPRGVPRLAAQVTRSVRLPGPPNYVEPRLQYEFARIGE